MAPATQGDSMRTIRIFFQAFREQWRDETFRVIVGLASGLLVIGTVFYTTVEHWSPLDALYFCVVTLATVGYGDLTPKTDLGKLFTIIYVLVGVGIIVVFASTVVEAMVRDQVERRERDRAQRQTQSETDGPGASDTSAT